MGRLPGVEVVKDMNESDSMETLQQNWKVFIEIMREEPENFMNRICWKLQINPASKILLYDIKLVLKLIIM